MLLGPEQVINVDQPGHDPGERTRTVPKARKATGFPSLDGAACEAPDELGKTPTVSREYEIKEEKPWPARKSASSSRRTSIT